MNNGNYFKDTLFKADEEAANEFMNVLLKSKIVEVQEVRGKVAFETSDKTVYKEERDETRRLIQALYDIVVKVDKKMGLLSRIVIKFFIN